MPPLLPRRAPHPRPRRHPHHVPTHGLRGGDLPRCRRPQKNQKRPPLLQRARALPMVPPPQSRVQLPPQSPYPQPSPLVRLPPQRSLLPAPPTRWPLPRRPIQSPPPHPLSLPPCLQPPLLQRERALRRRRRRLRPLQRPPPPLSPQQPQPHRQRQPPSPLLLGDLLGTIRRRLLPLWALLSPSRSLLRTRALPSPRAQQAPLPLAPVAKRTRGLLVAASRPSALRATRAARGEGSNRRARAITVRKRAVTLLAMRRPRREAGRSTLLPTDHSTAHKTPTAPLVRFLQGVANQCRSAACQATSRRLRRIRWHHLQQQAPQGRR